MNIGGNISGLGWIGQAFDFDGIRLSAFGVDLRRFNPAGKGPYGAGVYICIAKTMNFLVFITFSAKYLLTWL
jgi:hypothetical protein